MTADYTVGHGLAIKALSTKSPAEMTHKVAMGDALAVEKFEPIFCNGYWLVTFAAAKDVTLPY